MADDVLHELHSTVFHSLIPRGCDECRMPPGHCDAPRGLDGDGQLTRGDDPSCVVTWPACPGRYLAVRRHGQQLVPLSEIAAELYDRGAHRQRIVPAGLAIVVNEWRRCRELPRVLIGNKQLKQQQQRQRQGQGVGR